MQPVRSQSPCSEKADNPCGGNPSGAGGALACATCHVDGTAQMSASFAEAYPHRVAMPHQAAGVGEVNAAEMVQFCMVTPMANEPLSWSGRQLAALTAYVEKLQKGFEAPTGRERLESVQSLRSREPAQPLRQLTLLSRTDA